MIDPSDNKILDLIGKPARRGRPPTGKAMTSAQRKRVQRERERKDAITGYKDLSDRALCEAVAREIGVAKRQRSAGRDESCDTTKWHLDRLLQELRHRVASL